MLIKLSIKFLGQNTPQQSRQARRRKYTYTYQSLKFKNVILVYFRTKLIIIFPFHLYSLSIQRSRYFDEADSENVEIKDIEKRINDENVKVESYQRNIKAIETEIATTKNDIQTENLKKEKCQEAQKKLHSMKRAKQNAETQVCSIYL